MTTFFDDIDDIKKKVSNLESSITKSTISVRNISRKASAFPKFTFIIVFSLLIVVVYFGNKYYSRLSELNTSISDNIKREVSNQITTTLPDSIGLLNNLRGLVLDGNVLTSLSDSIGRLTNLTVLNLGYNKLTSLPDSIGRLTNLQALDLRDNQLTSLPDSIGRLTNLEYWDLYNNQLSKEEKLKIRRALPKTDIYF